MEIGLTGLSSTHNYLAQGGPQVGERAYSGFINKTKMAGEKKQTQNKNKKETETEVQYIYRAVYLSSARHSIHKHKHTHTYSTDRPTDTPACFLFFFSFLSVVKVGGINRGAWCTYVRVFINFLRRGRPLRMIVHHSAPECLSSRRADNSSILTVSWPTVDPSRQIYHLFPTL